MVEKEWSTLEKSFHKKVDLLFKSQMMRLAQSSSGKYLHETDGTNTETQGGQYAGSEILETQQP